jgi:hypothetical protein
MVRREVEENHSYLSTCASILHYSTKLLQNLSVNSCSVIHPTTLAIQSPERVVVDDTLGSRYISIIKSAKVRLLYSLGHVCVRVAGEGTGITDASTFFASHSRGTVSHENVERSQPGLL